MDKGEILAKVGNHRLTIVTALTALETALEPMARDWVPPQAQAEMIEGLVGLLDFAERQVEGMKELLRQWPAEEG